MIFCFLILSASKEVYRFRVGLQPLNAWMQGGIQAIEFLKSNPGVLCGAYLGNPFLIGATLVIKGVKPCETPSHAAFLLGTDLFEYNINGYTRRRNVGREAGFDWNHLGNKVNGKTYVTPDQLEEAIKNSHEWDGKYNILNHNCHHFVKWCLEHVGAGYFYKNYNHRYLS